MDERRDDAASTNDLDPDATVVLSRSVGDRGRLNVELRLLGLTAFVWVAGLVQGYVWLWVVVGLGELPRDLPLAALFVPQLVALLVVLTVLYVQLPTVRWPRSGSLVRLPSPAPLLALGFPALLLTPLVVARDRRARTYQGPPPPRAIDHAFFRLLRLPRVAGLQFLAWGAIAYIMNAVAIGLHYGWSRTTIAAVTVLLVALLGPFAAIVSSRARAILRPEYLTAPRETARTFRRLTDLRLKLSVTAAIASLGIIAAPLAGGYLWMSSLASAVPLEAAQPVAEEIAALASANQEEHLGRVLAQHPQAALRRDGQLYGASHIAFPDSPGPVDRDGDGVADLLVHHHGTVSVAVPMHGPSPLRLDFLVFGGLICLASSIGSILLIARDVHRDVTRASNQVEVVSRGDVPAPLTEGSFSTAEIRQLVQSVDRLVERITETNIAKYVAIEKAKEADRLKSQFLANMSHDLRSPLNSILGFSELLLTGIDGDLSDTQREMVDTVHRAGRDLLQQIDDILDTAKIDAGRLEIHPEPAPPATLLSRAIQNARKRQHRDIDYQTDIAPGLPPAFVDPYRTVQALENVLLFASERMESGTVHVTVRPASAEAGRMISVVVETPVRPATAEQLSLARKGFHRIPGHRGLGLGLPLAGTILELEAGSLGIEDLGDGMVFSVQIPAPETRRTLRSRAS